MYTKLIPCPYCKTPIPDDCVYCDTCGEKLRKCTSCGAFAKADGKVKICTKCGKPLGDIPQTPKNDDTITIDLQPQPDNAPNPVSYSGPSDPGKTTRPGVTSAPPPFSPTPDHLVCLTQNIRIGFGHEAIIGRRGSYGSVFQNCPSISGLHAKLIKSGNSWQIMDIGSSFGTYVNGNSILPNVPVTINVGDIVKFADVEFKVTE